MARPYEQTLTFTNVGATVQTLPINLLAGELKAITVVALDSSGAMIDDALVSVKNPARQPVIDELTPSRANHDPRNQYMLEYATPVANNDSWTVSVKCAVSTGATVMVVFTEIVPD